MKAKWSFLVTLVIILTACGPVIPIDVSVSKSNPAWPGMKPGWSTFWAPPAMNNPFYDPAGYIWVLNKRGIYRWEIASGKMDLLTTADGLPAEINTLTAFEGKIWASTPKGDVAIYDGKQWTTEKVTDKPLHKFFQTPGRLWVSSSTCAEQHLYFREKGVWSEFKNLPKNFIPESMGRSQDGNYWFENWTATWSFDGQNWKEYKNLTNVRKIFATPDGIIYFVFDQLVLISDGKTFTPVILPGDYYTYYLGQTFQTSTGELLVFRASENKTAILIHSDGRAETVSSPIPEQKDESSEQLFARQITPQGVLMSKSNQIGLYKAGQMQTFEYKENAFEEIVGRYNFIGFAPDGALWLTDRKNYRVLLRYDGQKLEQPFGKLPEDTYLGTVKINAQGELWASSESTGELTKFNLGAEPVRYKIAFYPRNFEFAPDGSLWLLGMDGYLAHIHPQNLIKGKVNVPEYVRVGDGLTERTLRPDSLKFGPKGDIWVYIYRDGFYRYDGIDWQAIESTIKFKGWPSYTIDAKGKLWAGTDYHLYKHDGKTWIDFPRDCIFPSSLTFTPDGAIWFINGCDGVYRFDEKDWTHYAREKEMSGTVPSNIFIAPDGALWFISSDAWIRYQP